MIEDTSTLGVGGVVQLEAAIEAKPVDKVGAHPPTHTVRGFEHRDIDAVAGEVTGGGETREPCSHDDDSHGAHVSRPDRNTDGMTTRCAETG